MGIHFDISGLVILNFYNILFLNFIEEMWQYPLQNYFLFPPGSNHT